MAADRRVDPPADAAVEALQLRVVRLVQPIRDRRVVPFIFYFWFGWGHNLWHASRDGILVIRARQRGSASKKNTVGLRRQD